MLRSLNTKTLNSFFLETMFFKDIISNTSLTVNFIGRKLTDNSIYKEFTWSVRKLFWLEVDPIVKVDLFPYGMP